MSYATEADLALLIGQPEVDALKRTRTDAVDEALDAADSEINGYLGRRYAVPIDPGTTRLKHASVEIARYILFNQLPDAMNTKSHQRQRYEDQIKWLEMVANGDALLYDDAGNLIEQESTGTGAAMAAGTRCVSFGSDFRSKYG